MTGKRKKYVWGRGAAGKVFTPHVISETDVSITRCGRKLNSWPWRVYPNNLPAILICKVCNPEKLDWESMRSIDE